ncbi:MAG: hypothetical protein HYZ28_21895 [Myxococcales bacterium]|nr:hypothetical protein [Myxococcales bacterium]
MASWPAKLAATFLLPPAFAVGSSVIERSVGERARMADRVILAQVLDTRTLVQDGDPRRMLTVTTLAVGETFKGDHLATLEVVQLGGKWGLWEAHAVGDATFETGETAILLLRCQGASPGRCTLLGLSEGKISVHGEEAFVRSIAKGTAARRKVTSVLEELRAALARTPQPRKAAR